MFLSSYTVWMWDILLTFRRYILHPRSNTRRRKQHARSKMSATLLTSTLCNNQRTDSAYKMRHIHVLKIFLAFLWNKMFITEPTRALYCTLPWVSWVQSAPLHHVSLRRIYFPSPHKIQFLPSDIFMLYFPGLPQVCTFPDHPIVFDLIISLIFRWSLNYNTFC
jgi:hypothetical protein